MEHLDIGEKKYMKVSSAARETGYTTDYIGQLSRAKKIDAKLVGRTWYVAYDELLAHRQSRGRSSHEKAKKAFKKEVAALEGETRIPIHREHTGVRKRIVSEHITYHTDEAELMPTPVAMRASSTPDKGSEQKLLVKKDADEHPVKFNAAEKPEIKWNGTIVVQSLADQSAEDEITNSNKGKTAPLTRHIHIRNAGKATPVEVLASELPQDSLLQQERFLTRVNRAHDLNTLETALIKSEAMPEASMASSNAPIQAIVAFSRVHTWTYNLLLIGFSVVVIISLSSFFLVQNSVYLSATDGNNSVPYYQKGFSVSTVVELKNNTNLFISSIRDMFKNKL